MPAKSRIFSELLAEEAENGTGQRDATVSAKRRKTGLNSKFDRMVEAMNATYQSPKRQRSSSVSSYGVPQTPVDAYEGLQFGALGQDFSVIKMRNDSRTDLDAEDADTSPDSRHTAPLPAWLSETFTTLTKKHPLRLLLPSSMRNANAEARKVPAINESEDVFAFGPPPMPAESSHALQSPIAFRARRHSTEVSFPARLASPPTLELFSTPGPASSIYQPSPPKPLMSSTPFLEAQPYRPGSSILSPAQYDDNDYQRLDSYEYVVPNSPPTRQLTNTVSSFALASSLLSSPQQYAYNNVASGHHFEQDDLTHIPICASPPQPIPMPATLSKPFCLPNDDSNYQGDNLVSDDVHMDRHFESTTAFSTPGPAYISSRPVYFDTPTDDPSSDPPDSAYDVDFTTLNFHWLPFDRKVTGPLEYKHLIKPILPTVPEQDPSVGTEDLASLPPSSDQLSADDAKLFESLSALHSSKTGSDRELPLATSSDPPVVNYESANARQIAVTPEEEGTLPSEPILIEDLPSPSPFRFTPPSRSHTLNQTDRSSQQRQASSPRISNKPQLTSRQLSAAASDRIFPPLPSSESREKVEDLNILKYGLFKTLDKIAPDPPNSDVDVQDVKVDLMARSHSIESWGEEQEQELLKLGL